MWWTEDLETKMMRAAYGDTRTYKPYDLQRHSELREEIVLCPAAIKTRKSGDRSPAMLLEMRHVGWYTARPTGQRRYFTRRVGKAGYMKFRIADANTGAILGEKKLNDSWKKADANSEIRTGQYRRFQSDYTGKE
ncbi:hypothetical protein SARC_01229 [Sphaeroforma arctica JP610]|uniref:Uncharacterized protein n=1 Tax=Sphaeroforma arctica JP610 TaxID=667725 RepID=A0A0L0GCC6_9EUKA|nr:hypothetical protein SARC_01229 [Sphaeroforma arctica JP610]KNC86650.1 hypothetical protein SARC_01229 [Sphaeroforma arctica JP610]|eukprot:XP_014160552.1 hypothetical protein SARC_01229 [Sphaeroforma arctica JP610]